MGMQLNQTISLANIATGIIPPVTANLEYYNLFNDATKLTRNFASGKPAATVVGAPTVNVENITLTNLGNYINTNVAQGQEMTIITIGQPTAASGNFVHWSNYGSTITNGGSGLTSTDFARASVSTGNPSISLSYSDDSFATRKTLTYGVASGADTIKLRAIASVFSQSGMTSRIRDLTNSKVSTNAIPTGGVLTIAGTILLGSHYTTVETSTGNLYAAMIYSRALTDSEINTLYASLKSYYTGKGISV
ncbi:hypothetical protein [Klebsiella quasipneumoniae]|uniref:hypothetical protein n=1 Tax=Klebsiella quasipneumoniae TaxID=1463165 RepID=UPI0010351A3C|nr:hypothetical protein [Klebsiella quasipneumoniae]